MTRDLRDDLAAYGLRIGTLEPLLHGCIQQLPALRAIQADMRAAKNYAVADKLRTVIDEIQGAADYAFPNRYPARSE